MKYIKRAIEDDILNDLSTKSKVILIYGIRRVGKTQLIKHIIQQTSMEYLLLNGENIEHTDLLKTRSTANYKRLLGKKKLLIIDEAQAIPEIGIKLKLMIDTIPDLKILATGSSSFDLNNQVGEPLVGRGYPELIHLDERNEKIEYLKDQINSYLLKDIIAFEGVKKRDKIVSLLKIIAFRVGSEISLEGIGRELQISKNTVDKYLDLLSKLFVIHKVSGFSRNLDNEITKKSKWFFMDNGIRNAIISNFNNFELRDDIGKLWENYFISERIKYQSYHRMQVNNYFWRHKNQQEIDWVEETESGLSAFEIKWNPDAKVRIPKQWEKAYSTARFIVLNRDNFLDFITDI